MGNDDTIIMTDEDRKKILENDDDITETEFDSDEDDTD